MTLPHGITLPKDKVGSGSGRHDWVNCTFYGEELEDVAAKKKAYFDEYPPRGYDTHTVGNITKHPDGYYFLHVKRWSSCD